MNFSIIKLSKTLMLYGMTVFAIGCASQGELKNQEPVSEDLLSSKAFEECLSTLAEPLAKAHNPATYHSGAKYALACLDEAPMITKGILQTSVMQVHAMAITQLLKSGDMFEAEQQLNAFKTKFPKRDLLLEDGSSFVDTIELIVGLAPKEQSAKGSLLNASTALKSELRRQQYWQHN